MEKEFITKDYFDATFERFEKKFDDFSNLVMESFGYLNVKIDEVAQRTEEKLGKRIDEVEQKLGARIDRVEYRLDAKIDARFNEMSNRMDGMVENTVSRGEHKALKSRVQTLENSPATA
jgi:hypothetical protein